MFELVVFVISLSLLIYFVRSTCKRYSESNLYYREDD